MRRRSKPINPVSKKRMAIMEVRGPLREKILAERPWCQRCTTLIMNAYRDTRAGPVQRSGDVHELLTRGRGGSITDEANCVALCRGCHDWIHLHPAQAEVDGWLISRWAKQEEARP
jgi:hypothetical protein